MAVSAGPCDSPAVNQRSMAAVSQVPASRYAHGPPRETERAGRRGRPQRRTRVSFSQRSNGSWSWYFTAAHRPSNISSSRKPSPNSLSRVTPLYLRPSTLSVADRLSPATIAMETLTGAMVGRALVEDGNQVFAGDSDEVVVDGVELFVDEVDDVADLALGSGALVSEAFGTVGDVATVNIPG